MSFCFLLCAAALAGGYSATSPDQGQHIILTSTRSAGESRGLRCRWTLYKDALPAASGQWSVAGLGVDSPKTNVAPPAVAMFRDRPGDYFLRIRFVTGDSDPEKETLLAVSQIDYPRLRVRPLSDYVGAPAVLTESADTYEFKTPSQRIRFDRGTGLISGYATGWWSSTEWFKRPMAFDFGDPAPKVRMETFSKPTETNGVWSFTTVSWWTCSISNFELRVSTDWQVRGDGRVVSLTTIRPFGLRKILPRVGWAFVLAPQDPLVQYFGNSKGLDGLYESSVADCGTHDATRGVSFDAGSDHFALSTLGGNFSLEVGATPSKATFCGLVAERDTETDHDWKLDILISPEKTLQAMAVPEVRSRDLK